MVEQIPAWALEIFNEIEEIKAMQDKASKPTPQEAMTEAEKTYSLGFYGDIKASSVPDWMKASNEREAKAIGSNYDFIDALEKDQPDKYSKLREHIASIQEEFKAANAPDKELTPDDIAKREIARERALKAMGDRMVPVAKEDKFFI